MYTVDGIRRTLLSRGLAQQVLGGIVRAAPLSAQIYDELRGRLRTGLFAPGERIVDATLARTLSVSRTPVREALTRLAAEGLLSTDDGGFAVPSLTVSDVAEIFQVRRLLEPAAARDAVPVIGPDGLAALSMALDRARQAQREADFAGFARASSDVRGAWLDRTPNGRLRDTLRRFDDQAAAVRQATLHDPRARAVALARYEDIAAAFSTGDAAKVERFTLRLIENASGFYDAATAAAS
jgi:DNA-binding GntR family transcriptional regulator